MLDVPRFLGRTSKNSSNTHRIHGAGIYVNIKGILMGSMLPYIAYMDPMGHGSFGKFWRIFLTFIVDPCGSPKIYAGPMGCYLLGTQPKTLGRRFAPCHALIDVEFFYGNCGEF
jgi:hypothetical protein